MCANLVTLMENGKNKANLLNLSEQSPFKFNSDSSALASVYFPIDAQSPSPWVVISYADISPSYAGCVIGSSHLGNLLD